MVPIFFACGAGICVKGCPHLFNGLEQFEMCFNIVPIISACGARLGQIDFPLAFRLSQEKKKQRPIPAFAKQTKICIET